MRQQTLGFTLLEVLIALVILALAFSTTFLSLNSATAHLISLQDKTAETWVAMNVITRAQLGLISLSSNGGTITGSEKMFNDNWDWVLTITPTPDMTVSELTVEVKNANGHGTVNRMHGYLSKSNLT